MSLSTGAQIGPYTIGDEIGAGGMGVVYRATDQNLKRDVAIKALPESFSADADWVARFEREAQTLAALNHPNIAQIYGLERADGTTALAMELIEGPTLADRIADGPLPPDEALGIAMQVADALEAAHGQSIVHRDLKPANIKLRSDGTVKVLDFGIAKTLDIRAASGKPAAMTTPAMTQTGIILGTAAYMSPEQARGRPIDQRTDIWAFGCLLYEMLTGQPAFAGEDVAITLARILANDTNMKSLPGVVSPAVRHTIELCLQKDERKRVADIRDVRLSLQGVFENLTPGNVEPAAIARPLWRRVLPVGVTAIAAVVLGLIGGQQLSRNSSELQIVKRFDYDLPEGLNVRSDGRHVIAISPDGSRFVYNAEGGLYLREIGELEARIITGTEANLASPTFSPDGLSVAYWDFGRQLRRIAISGGAPVVVAENVSSNVYGLSWEKDGTILFGQPEGIYRVAASGGVPELIIRAEGGEQLYGPRLLPDGDSVLFHSFATPGNPGRVFAQSIATGDRTVVLETGGDAHYLPTGHLIYALDGSLFGVRFDIDTLSISGGAVPLVQGIREVGIGDGAANYGIAEDGTLIYLVGGSNAVKRTLAWVSRDGTEEPINAPPRDYRSPKISPDGEKVLLDARDGDDDIWAWDLTRQTFSRLTFDPAQDRFAIWSPDGTRIAFGTTRQRSTGVFMSLYWKASDGTGSSDYLSESDGQLFPSAFTPDGKGILVDGATSGGDPNDDIGVFWFDGEGQATPLIATTFAEQSPDLSPDGNWLAYSSDESGQNEIYVRPFPNVDEGRWQVSTTGGVDPIWARNGREIFYRNAGAVVAVPIETEPSFFAGNPEVLFRGDYVLGPKRDYDVSADGEKFLMLKELEGESAMFQVIVALNWFEDLKRLVPTQ